MTSKYILLMCILIFIGGFGCTTHDQYRYSFIAMRNVDLNAAETIEVDSEMISAQDIAMIPPVFRGLGGNASGKIALDEVMKKKPEAIGLANVVFTYKREELFPLGGAVTCTVEGNPVIVKKIKEATVPVSSRPLQVEPVVETLNKLKALKEMGILTEQEYEMKRKLLIEKL